MYIYVSGSDFDFCQQWEACIYALIKYFQRSRHQIRFLFSLLVRLIMAMSMLKFLEYVLLQSPLCSTQEISSCPSSPVARDKIRVAVSQSSSLEALSVKQSSSPFCRALYSSPDVRQADDIEKRLELAATCIQEALALHRSNITETGNDKKSLSTSNLYKVPNVASSKKKSATTVPQGDPHSSVAGKSIKPRPLTPYPWKKTKPTFPDKTSTPRGSSTSTMGRISAGTNRRRTPNQSGLWKFVTAAAPLNTITITYVHFKMQVIYNCKKSEEWGRDNESDASYIE
jgi:hypothetical protein